MASDRGRPDAQPRHVFKRIVVLSLIVICSLNVWTGGPLLAIWVGAHLTNASGQPTLGVVAVVIVTLAAVDFALVRMIGSLNSTYDRLTGRSAQRRRTAWLRAMSDAPAKAEGRQRQVGASEAIIVVTVVAAVAAFEIWFFFFSSGGGIGRPH